MISHGFSNNHLPIWMQDPSIYMVWGFCIEVLLLGVALITAVNAISGIVPDFKTGGCAAFILIGFKYLFTFHLFNNNPGIGLAHLLIIQTAVMVVLVTLTLLLYRIPFGKAFLGALLILIAQYLMNILVNMLICAPFLVPTNIDSILRSMQAVTET